MKGNIESILDRDNTIKTMGSKARSLNIKSKKVPKFYHIMIFDSTVTKQNKWFGHYGCENTLCIL